MHLGHGEQNSFQLMKNSLAAASGFQDEEPFLKASAALSTAELVMSAVLSKKGNESRSIDRASSGTFRRDTQITFPMDFFLCFKNSGLAQFPVHCTRPVWTRGEVVSVTDFYHGGGLPALVKL